MEEKNLLKPRECFSGVGVDEKDEEVDMVDLYFGLFELIGDLKRFDSVSDGLHGVLNDSMGDSAPVLLPLPEAAVSISA